MAEPLRFGLPTQIIFGPGCRQQLGAIAADRGSRRVHLITDRGVHEAGLVDPVRADLEAAGITVTLTMEVSPNPRDFEVVAAAQAVRQAQADLIVAIGGGSPIDLAKAASGLATNDGLPQDWVPPRTFARPPVPLVAIPTTAGTGSEVTRSAVINDTARMIKISLRDRQIAPVVALVDPELTDRLPPAITAATGMDALTHAIEAYTCRRATPFTDALALHAIRLIAGALERAVGGGDSEARIQMSAASTIAGIAFSNADVAAVHCIAEAIGGRYDTPHGVANSLFLPYLFAFDAEAAPRRHADVAVALGVATPDDVPEWAAARGAAELHRLARAIGIPALRELPGIQPEDFPWIAAASVANLSNESNARPMDEDAYLHILDAAWSATPSA